MIADARAGNLTLMYFAAVLLNFPVILPTLT